MPDSKETPNTKFKLCSPGPKVSLEFGDWDLVINSSRMDEAFSNLASALRERLAIIQDEQSRHDLGKHTARLRAISEKIDQLAAALPKPIDPRLAHFLDRKSYDKALAILEGKGD